MQKAFSLCNKKHRQIVRSEKPLEKVRLLSFEYKETDSNDLSPFIFEWHLPKSKQTVCQHYNMSYNTMSQTISGSPNHDLLKQMRTFYGANEDFYEFTIKLNRSFKSEDSSVMISIDIPE